MVTYNTMGSTQIYKLPVLSYLVTCGTSNGPSVFLQLITRFLSQKFVLNNTHIFNHSRCFQFHCYLLVLYCHGRVPKATKLPQFEDSRKKLKEILVMNTTNFSLLHNTKPYIIIYNCIVIVSKLLILYKLEYL